MRTVALLLAASLFTTPGRAHDVLWWGNDDGFHPARPLELGLEDILDVGLPVGLIGIVPAFTGLEFLGIGIFEQCTVSVTVDPPKSPFLAAEVLPLNPGLQVDIEVSVLDLPPTLEPILTEITGEWHATGFPDPNECTAVIPNRFSVPVKIFYPGPWSIGLAPGGTQVNLATGSPVALQAAPTLDGPWTGIGVGQNFSLAPVEDHQFFKGMRMLGGGITGTVTDPAGQPLGGVGVGLPAGGPAATTDANGNFTVKSLPRGDDLLQLLKSLNFVDPVSGENRTEKAGIDVIVPVTKPYEILKFKVEAQVFPVPACNCTPWCSIGFGTLGGAQTPVYFAGGAFPPKGAPANCGPVEVTVTSPDGATFKIRSGTGKHQNSGAGAASGTWTVTTTVCGQSKSCTITVP